MGVEKFIIWEWKKRTEQKFYRNKNTFDVLSGKEGNDAMENFPHI